MFGKVLKYLGLGLLGLVAIAVFIALVIPSTVSQFAVQQVLDDMGVKHQGIDTLDVSFTSARVELGPVIIGEGEQPIRAERMELELAPLEYFDDRARVTVMRLTGADIVVRRLPEGDFEVGGMKLSDLMGGDKDAEPEQAAAEPEDEGEPIAYGVDVLEIADSRVFLRDINGGEFELEVRDLRLDNLQSWDKGEAANLTWNMLFNGIELKHDVSMQLFSSPRVIEVDGHMRELTLPKIARTTGEPLDQAVDGTVSSDSQYRIVLNDDGTYEAESKGQIRVDGLGIDTPEGDKVAVPAIELALNVKSKGGGDLPRQVAGDITVSADRIDVESADGAKVGVANLSVGGTELNIVDVSGRNDSIVMSALENELSLSADLAQKSMVRLLLDVAVATAREIGSRDLQIEGHPAISVGEAAAVMPGANQGDPPMLDASLGGASVSVEDLSAGAINGVWKIAGSAIAQLSDYRSDAALEGQGVASELGSADLKLSDLHIETDGTASSMELGMELALQGLASTTSKQQQISIGHLKLHSPKLSAAGGAEVEERAFGQVSMEVQDVAGTMPAPKGNMRVAGGTLRVDLNDLDLQRLESSGGGGVLLEDWQVTQAGTKLAAGFKALAIDVPAVQIVASGDAVTVKPGTAADNAADEDNDKADAADGPAKPADKAKAQDHAANGSGTDGDTGTTDKAKAQDHAGTGTDGDSGTADKAAPAADSQADPAPVRTVAGIPVPPVRPAEVPARVTQATPPAITPVADVPELAGNGVFGVNLEGFHAKAPVDEGLAEVSGAQTRLSLNSFGLSVSKGGEANIGGALAFYGWRFADSVLGIDASFKGLRARTPGLKAVFGKGFSLDGAIDSIAEGIGATVPGTGGRNWNVTVNDVSAKMASLKAAGGTLSAQGDVSVGGVQANESGEDGHQVAVGGVKAAKINHTPEKTELESLLIENLQAVLGKHLVGGGTDDGKAATEPEAQPASADGSVAPLRIGTFSVSPGSTVTLTNAAGSQAVTTKITVDKASVAPVDLADKTTRSDVDVALRINESGKLTAQGNLPPLDPESGLDMKVRASGIQVEGFSPFSKEAVGVGLAGGTAAAAIDAKGGPQALNGNANIVLKQMAIEPMSDAQKKAFTDQYTFSPEYIIDILSDSDGVIDLNVPISGTTKDPDFDISGIAVKAMSGMATSALTSPFSTIGSVAGGAVGAVGGAAGAVGGLITGGGASADGAKASGEKAAETETGKAAEGTVPADKAASDKAAADKAAADKAAQEKAAQEALEKSFGTLGDSLFGN